MDYGGASEALAGSMDSLYEQNTDSMSIVAGSNGTPAEGPPAAEATEEEIDGKTFHVCTTDTAYVIKQTEDGGMEVLGDLLEHLQQLGYTEGLQPGLYEALRQHQSHETFFPCTMHVPRSRHARPATMQKGQPVRHDHSQRHMQLP